MLKLNLCMATIVQHLQTHQAAVSFATGSGRLHTVVSFDSNLLSLVMNLCVYKNSQNNPWFVCLLLSLMTFFNGTDFTATLGSPLVTR
jgi:hypothetical protein